MDAAETPPPAAETASPTPPNQRRKLFLIGGVVLVLFLVFALPAILRALHTVSTDDAYVNGYVTFVAPRVAGQVAKVWVEDNNRVKKGDVLVELDPEPFRVVLAIRQSALETAKASQVVAEAEVRSQIALARSNRFKLTHAIEDVDNQIALIRQRVATWEQNKATMALAETEFERAKNLLGKKVVSQEEYDRANEAVSVARAQVTQALQNVYQARVALGLPAEAPAGQALTDVPEDLDQNFSSVRQALAELIQSAAVLGVVPSSYDLNPKQVLAEFYKRSPDGNIDTIYAQLAKSAPGLKKAQAAVDEAQRNVDQAELDLRYCKITAEIDGVITRRNVNPGNNVQVGQSLMAIRSLTQIWVDANFKETQLRNLRIGQKVELLTDVYGKGHPFEGRISGFTFGTGSTLALLPPQNATGNFVKVVQRLPVRVDLVNYDPDEYPLFVGISVEPVVDIKSTPTGPDAGKFLQATSPAH